MKKSTEYILIILTLIICFSIPVGIFLYVRDQKVTILPLQEDLQLAINKYIQNNNYEQGLAYLEDFKKLKEKTAQGLINYYFAKLKYQRLRFLSNKSQWDEYHIYRDAYISDIIKETEITLATLPYTEFAVHAQFLQYQAYNLMAESNNDVIFEKFKKMLFQYCKKTNDYTLAKNYALTLYEDNDLLRAKEINDIYITYIEENLPIDQLALELKSYADSILSQGKDRTAVSLHKQYLEIKFDQEDEDKTTQEIKDILDKYIKAKQFYMAREFAELALNKYPNCKLEDYFQLQLALCLFETKEVRKSKGIYYKILDEYPDSKYRSEALCQLLDEVKFYSYRDRQAALEEIESLKKYATNPITKAYLIITTAETYYLDKQYNKAINEYNLLLDTYPESVLALHAEKRIKECKELNN